MMIASYVVMILFGVGMLWSNRVYKKAKKKSHVPWARPFAGFCGVVATGLALTNLGVMLFHHNGPDLATLRKWDRVQCDYLGQYLGEHAQGHRALVVTEPVNEYNREMVQARVDALKEGLGGRVEVVAVASPAPTEIGTDENGQPLYEPVITAASFDAVIKDHPDCNLVISLAGLPLDYQDMKLWKEPRDKIPDLALVDGPLFELKKAIQAGYIDVVVAYKPVPPTATGNPGQMEPPPNNVDVAFHQRFLLAHAGNVNELARQYRGIFVE